jgi:hypothetical protein
VRAGRQRFQQVAGADHVDAVHLVGIVVGHEGDAGQVHDHVRPHLFDGRGHRGAVEQVDGEDVRAGGLARQHGAVDVIAGGAQLARHVVAGEAAQPGDQGALALAFARLGQAE